MIARSFRIALAVVAAIGLATSTATAADKPIKIVYASYLSPQHITNPVMTEFYADVKKDSNGTVIIEPHVAGSLLSGRDIPGGVRDGVADAGYFVGAYIPSEMPVDTYLSQFSMLNNEPLVMTAVLNELELFKCPECTAEYEKFNTKFLATYALTPYVYHCRTELKSLADFKGKRLRGISAYAALATSLGAVPVNVSPDEAYTSLDTGVLDCALHSIAAQKARSYGEVAKYVILDPLGGFLGASTFALRIPKWNEMSPQQRKAITSNLATLVSGAIFNYIEDDQTVIKEYTKKGTKFYHADPDFQAFVRKFGEDYTAKAIEKGKSMGIKDPQAIPNELNRLAVKWRKLLKENNANNQKSYAALLDREIFSKIDTGSDIKK